MSQVSFFSVTERAVRDYERDGVVCLRKAFDGDWVRRMRVALDTFEGPVRILLASADRTAQVFEGAWPKDDPRISRCANASHAFVEPQAREWLETKVLEALRT